MPSLEKVRAQLKRLCETNPHIHMDISLKHPKVVLQNAEATLLGAYSHIFRIAETSSGARREHTLQYKDILIGDIVIAELAED